MVSPSGNQFAKDSFFTVVRCMSGRTESVWAIVAPGLSPI
jgi:hypothetical protein